jgi:hypothetical protein
MRQQWNSAGSDPHATLGRVRGDEARTKELHNLRVALATFALQLDAFELRIRERPLGAQLGMPGVASDGRRQASEGIDARWSTRSHGKKSAG